MRWLGLCFLVFLGWPAAAQPPAAIDPEGHRVRRPAAASPRPVERLAGSTGAWQPLGPEGGEVRDVVFSIADPSIALAATMSGIYRSTDGGATWAHVPALGYLWINEFEAAADGTIWAGTSFGLWKSTDGGVTWTQLSLGVGLNADVIEVTLDPGDSSRLWLGLGGALGNQPTSVLRSTDAGVTWTPATPPLAAPTSCHGIAVSPSDSDQVVAVFSGFPSGGSVWFSADGGTTWVDRTAGLPPYPLNDVVHDGSRVLVGGGQLFGSQYLGLYASSDGGASWTPLHDAAWPRPAVNDLELDPNDPGVILAATAFGGVHKSTDGGASWQIGTGGTEDLAVLSARFAPGSSDVVVLGATAQGVLASSDGGASFASSTAGINLLDVTSVAANSVDPAEMATAFQGQNEGGVFTSTDGGATWSPEPVPPSRYQVVLFAPDGTLYAVSSGPSTVTPEGLYRRNPDGTWTGLGPDQGGLYETDVHVVRFSADQPGLILAGGGDSGVAGHEPTVWRSLDAGESWVKVYEGFFDAGWVTDLEIFVAAGDTREQALASYYPFSGHTGGVLRSTDGGASWVESSNGLPDSFEGAALCALEGDARSFYLADRAFGSGNGGLYRSTDAGHSWHGTGYAGVALEEVVCGPGNVLYVAPVFAEEKILRSDDLGAAFTAFDDGLESAGAPQALDLVPGPEPRLLLATHRGSFTSVLPEPAAGCTPGATTLCLPADGRFEVTVAFETVQSGGRMGSARAIPLDATGNSDGGMFYFLNSGNPEFLVKVLDGCAINGHWWVFYAATTNVGFELTVTDTQTPGATRVYVNPDLSAAATVTDVEAFATCP